MTILMIAAVVTLKKVSNHFDTVLMRGVVKEMQTLKEGVVV